MMGAPTIMVEKLPRGDEIVGAFKALEEYLGRPIDAHGLGRGRRPQLDRCRSSVAAQLGMPLVDADVMGRAFPEMQMCIPTLYGVSATPMAMADEKGNRVVIDTIDNHWTERIARSITIDMGCTALIALYPMTGAQLKAGDSSRARSGLRGARTGRRARRAPRTATRSAAVVERLGALRLFDGKIVDVARRTEAGFARPRRGSRASATDAGSDARPRLPERAPRRDPGRGGRRSVPDLIIVLDAETGEPITTEELRYGFRVTVIAAPCDPRWRTPAGLELVGPRYFGYDIDYVPIEERRAAADRRAARNGPR